MAQSKPRRLSLYELGEEDKLKRLIRQYNYVRFTYADLNGAQRGVTYTARSAERCIKTGLECYSGLMLCGPQSEIPSCLNEIDPCDGNALLLPDPESFGNVPWVGGDKYKVCELMCESYFLSEKTPQEFCPRYACRKQLLRLEDAGFTLKSGWELEFRLEDNTTKQPVYSGNSFLSHINVGLQENFLFEAESHFFKCGIECEKIHTEIGPGQFEITLKADTGMKSIDNSFKVIHGLKEIARRKGLMINSLSKPDPSSCGVGCHFNHSLWNKNGQSVFYSGPNTLSDIGRHWLGGLLTHCRALVALCSPTVNCYRQLHTVFFPSTVSWGYEDRHCAFRVKCRLPESTRIESRLVGGLCHPYHVTAAHVAAGLDGLARQLGNKLNEKDKEEIPHSLEEALKALEEDTVIVEALGPELVKWFVRIKREIDLVIFKDSDVRKNLPGAYSAEREMYAQYQ